MTKKRNYKIEYKRYHSKPRQKKRRAQRNAARKLMIKTKGQAAVAGKDVDHKDRNTANNQLSNLRIQTKAKNRGRNK